MEAKFWPFVDAVQLVITKLTSCKKGRYNTQLRQNHTFLPSKLGKAHPLNTAKVPKHVKLRYTGGGASIITPRWNNGSNKVKCPPFLCPKWQALCVYCHIWMYITILETRAIHFIALVEFKSRTFHFANERLLNPHWHNILPACLALKTYAVCLKFFGTIFKYKQSLA